MPYAQNHYPFENKENFEACFPADFIAEGIDQTRGWSVFSYFYNCFLYKSMEFVVFTRKTLLRLGFIHCWCYPWLYSTNLPTKT